MIRVNIRENAINSGITTAYKLQQKTGFHPTMAYRLWKEDWKQSDLKTLNTLCNVLKCTPSDILVFTPDPIEEI
jgi:DNA-binding Xre family transcriptional regulator